MRIVNRSKETRSHAVGHPVGQRGRPGGFELIVSCAREFEPRRRTKRQRVGQGVCDAEHDSGHRHAEYLDLDAEWRQQIDLALGILAQPLNHANPASDNQMRHKHEDGEHILQLRRVHDLPTASHGDLVKVLIQGSAEERVIVVVVTADASAALHHLGLVQHKCLFVVREHEERDPYHEAEAQLPPGAVAFGDELGETERILDKIPRDPLDVRFDVEPRPAKLQFVVLGSAAGQLIEVLQVVHEVDEVLLHAQIFAKLFFRIVCLWRIARFEY